jgi:hypothetical protein
MKFDNIHEGSALKIAVGLVIAELFLIGGVNAQVGNLLAEWHFDGDANDSSGNGNNGTIYGAIFTSGINGQGLSFDGVDDYVNVPDSPTLNPEHITISAWILPYKNGDYSSIVNKYHADGYFLRIGQGFQVDFSATGTAWSPELVEGKWTYIVGSYDGTRVSIYVDGILKHSHTWVSPRLRNVARSLTIGSFPGGMYFKGKIDEIKMYDYGLSDSEILSNYLEECHNNEKCHEIPHLPPPPPAPELPTIALMGLGVFGLLLVVKKKK